MKVSYLVFIAFEKQLSRVECSIVNPWNNDVTRLKLINIIVVSTTAKS